MEHSDRRNRDSADEDGRDGIRERPGDLKDDGETRERRRDRAWHPGDADEKGEGDGGARDGDREPAKDGRSTGETEPSRGT